MADISILPDIVKAYDSEFLSADHKKQSGERAVLITSTEIKRYDAEYHAQNADKFDAFLALWQSNKRIASFSALLPSVSAAAYTVEATVRFAEKPKIEFNGRNNYYRISCVFRVVSVSAVDTEDPVITINSPTTSPTYNNGTAGTINLSGTASDNVGVVFVNWSNNRGGSGTATGTSSWSILDIPLLDGENIITVTAHDAAGNSGSDIITVSYQAPDGQWVLETGYWDDDGIWDDSETWNEV